MPRKESTCSIILDRKTWKMGNKTLQCNINIEYVCGLTTLEILNFYAIESTSKNQPCCEFHLIPLAFLQPAKLLIQISIFFFAKATFNSFPHTDVLWCLCSRQFLKTLFNNCSFTYSLYTLSFFQDVFSLEVSKHAMDLQSILLIGQW